MTLHPRNHRDLMLAPVAAEIDLNLQRMRDVSPRDELSGGSVSLDLGLSQGIAGYIRDGVRTRVA